MFCGKCGAKIDDGSKFCASCGAPVEITAAAAAPAVEAAAQPVQEPTAPAVEAVAQPVQEPAAPAVNAYAQPVQEPTAPAVEAAAQPVQEPAAPAVEAVAQPVQEPAAPAVEAVAQPVQEPAAPAVNAYAQPAPAFDGGFQPVKKKKSKAPLIAGLTAGAVLIGGGAVGYFCFHDDITRLFMGNVGYAKMIDKQSFDNIPKPDTGSDQFIGYAAGAFDSAAASAIKSMRTVNNGETPSASDTAENLIGTVDPSWDWNKLIKIPEGTAISVESSLDIKLGTVFAMLDSDTTRTVIDAINGLVFTQTTSNGDTDMISFGVKDKDGHSGSIDVYKNESGLLITFTGISDKKIFISKDEFDDAKEKREENAEKLDPEELKRLRSEIVTLFYDSFDAAEITYTDGVEWTKSAVGSMGELSASVKGNDVKVHFTAEQVKEIGIKAAELIKNDEYLIKYAESAFGVSKEDYQKNFDTEKMFKDHNVALTVDHIVDVHNNVLASCWTFTGDNDSGTIALSTLHADKSGAFSLDISDSKDGTGSFTCVDRKSGSTSGDAVMQFRSDAKGGIDIAVECSYTDAAKKAFNGSEVPVGKYVIKFSDPDKFWDSVNKLTRSGSQDKQEDTVMSTMAENGSDSSNPFGSNEKIFAEVKKLTITYESSVDGDVYNTSFLLSLGEIGSLGITSRAEKKNETVEMPDTTGAYSVSDDSFMDDIGIDSYKWLKGIASGFDGGSGAISDILDMQIKRAEAEKNIKKHYSAYTSSSRYDASEYASRIYDELGDTVRLYTSANPGMDSGVIKLYFKDGKAEIIDDGGISGLNCEITDASSAYAEVLFDERIDPGIAGVNVVLTDDRNDLPDDLPDTKNYYNSMYPWEGDRDRIGEFIVATYPYLYDGEPTLDLPEAHDIDELNRFAEYAADALTDFLGRNGDASGYIDGAVRDVVACFRHDSDYSYWSAEDGYSGTTYTDSCPLSYDLSHEITERLASLTDEHSEFTDICVAYYFKGGKLAGVMAGNINTTGAVSMTEKSLPGISDYARGSYAGWKDADGDGEPDPGCTENSIGEDAVIGTYCTSTKAPLTYSENEPEPEKELSGGYWKVTAVNGTRLEEIAEQLGTDVSELDIRIEIEGDHIYLTTYDSDERLGMLALSGEEYEGKPALGLVNEDNDTTEGYFVFDSDTEARLIDQINNVNYDLEFIESSDKSDINRYVGIWHRTDGSDDKYDLKISSNYVALETNSDEIYNWKFGLLNPNGTGFDIFDQDGSNYSGHIEYDSDNETLYLTGANGEIIESKRTEEPPVLPYTGMWTLDTYDGEDFEEYCEKNNTAPEDFTMNLEIGEYSTIITSKNTFFAHPVLDAAPTTFKILYDSSLYFDCTYNESTDTIDVIMRFDDSSDSIGFTMKRGSFEFG